MSAAVLLAARLGSPASEQAAVMACGVDVVERAGWRGEGYFAAHWKCGGPPALLLGATRVGFGSGPTVHLAFSSPNLAATECQL